MTVNEHFIKRLGYLVDQKLLEQAICFARSYTRKFPNDSLYHESLGYVYWLRNDIEHAENCLARALACGGVSCSGLVLHLRIALQEGKRKRARTVLAHLLENHELSRSQKELLASKLGGMHEYSAALQVCQHLALEHPESADAWYGIGFYQERLGCAPIICVKALRQAAKLSGCVCSKVHLAKVLAELELWDESHALVRFIPISQLSRACWAHTVFQIALANQDFALADAVRFMWFRNDQCLSENN
jgi:tetratricopeptide (TPR) repeat protein